MHFRFSLKCNVCGISGVLSGFFVVTFEGRARSANEGLECKCGNGLELEGGGGGYFILQLMM